MQSVIKRSVVMLSVVAPSIEDVGNGSYENSSISFQKCFDILSISSTIFLVPGPAYIRVYNEIS
jgi:hypothetical protein